MMIIAQILAGGIGSRMSKTTPKQFLKLNNLPMILYSIKVMLLVDEIDYIIVSIGKKFFSKMTFFLNKYIPSPSKKIFFIEGGDSRDKTILNCLDYLVKNEQATNCLLITHDAARPFITTSLIQDVINATKKTGIASLAISCTDTIISNDKDNYSFLDRNNIFQIQTPQGFYVNKYMEALNKLTISAKQKITDATSVFLLNSEKITLVDGDKNNIKITTNIDLQLAKLLAKTHQFS